MTPSRWSQVGTEDRPLPVEGRSASRRKLVAEDDGVSLDISSRGYSRKMTVVTRPSAPTSKTSCPTMKTELHSSGWDGAV
jgi:hypothetical protein